jgi:DNA-binding transcriptional ArsR family regulator
VKRALRQPFLIGRTDQLRALASPMRQELLDVLEAAGPSAISELAERLGRAPDSLYFHIRELVRVGLVVEVERRKVGRHVFVVYDLVGRPLRIDRSKARRADLQSVVAGILRLATRDYQRGLADPTTVPDGPERNHWGARVRGWIDASEVARANELLEELSDLIREGHPGPGRQPVALAWVLAPVPPRRGAARPAEAAADEVPVATPAADDEPGPPTPTRATRSRRTSKRT